MDIMAFRECIRNWFFIEKLMSGGASTTTSAGGRVESYEKVPDRVKCALKLDAFEKNGGEAMRNGDNETQPLIPNNKH